MLRIKYDYYSITHYSMGVQKKVAKDVSKPVMTVLNKSIDLEKIGQREALSAKDIEDINTAYDCLGSIDYGRPAGKTKKAVLTVFWTKNPVWRCQSRLVLSCGRYSLLYSPRYSLLYSSLYSFRLLSVLPLYSPCTTSPPVLPPILLPVVSLYSRTPCTPSRTPPVLPHPPQYSPLYSFL